MEKWILFAFIVCLITALDVTNFKFVSNNCGVNDLSLIISIGFVLSGLLSLIYLAFRKDEVKKIKYNRNIIIGIILFGTLSLVGRYFFSHSIRLAPNLGYSHIIVNLNVILTLIFAFLLFGQKINIYTFLGILICLFGLFVIVKNY